MAINYPGPYQLRWKYDFSGFLHNGAVNLNCQTPPNLNDPFTAITLVNKNGTNQSLDSMMNAFGALYADLLHTGQTMQNFELWKYTPGTFDAQFVSSDSTTIAGTSTTVPQNAFYTTYSFRSGEGGVGFISIFEHAVNTHTRRSYSTIGPKEQFLVDYVVGVSSPILARDTSYFYSFIRASGGTNEKLWRKRYRQ